MGARGYDDDWDSLAAWSHIGYPADLNSGQRPSFQGGFTMDGTDADSQEILHRVDVFPGQVRILSSSHAQSSPDGRGGRGGSQRVDSPRRTDVAWQR